MDTPQKRRLTRRVAFTMLVGVLVVAMASAGGAVAWDRYWRQTGPTDPGFTCRNPVPAGPRRPLAAIGVRRVTLIGDSIMWQASCAVADSLAPLGVETFHEAVPGTGLLSGGVDWVARTRRLLRQQHPDIVVAIFVGNYFPPFAHTATGALIEPDSPEFLRAWRDRARALSNEVRAAGAAMYWVSPPPIDVPTYSEAQRLFDGYRTIAGDHALDSGRVLAGPRGTEVFTKETCGRRRVIRTFDGVHLTPDGARIYGQQIAHDLSAAVGVLTSPRPC